MARRVIPPFALAQVSDRRRKFLARWRIERGLDLDLGRHAVAASHNCTAEQAAVSIRPSPIVKTAVADGDIRLLRETDVSDPNRFVYVTVLKRRDNGTAVVAPFSPYSVPATKDEWLTGLPAKPLQVLELWNAQPVPLFALANSWRVHQLDAEALRVARELYRHSLRGSWPNGRLREQVGLAVLSPGDERLSYLNEELSLMGPLRQRLLAMVAASADYDAVVHTGKDGARHFYFAALASHSSAAIRFEARENRRLVEVDCERVWRPCQRLAAATGGTYAEVLIFTVGKKTPSMKRALLTATSHDASIVWQIQDWPDALPGLPVCICTSSHLCLESFTCGTGSTVRLTGLTKSEYLAAIRPSTWLLVHAPPKCSHCGGKKGGRQLFPSEGTNGSRRTNHGRRARR
jgi:hypothetical protein